MDRRVVIAVATCAGIVLALFAWKQGYLGGFSRIGQALEDAGIPIPGYTRSSRGTPFQINAPGEVIAQTSADVMLPYGSVTIAPGTRLWALRQNEKGVVARFAGHEVILPPALFRPVN